MQPVYFLAHGSPMNALETNYFTQDWLNLSQSAPCPETPEAIVIFSAHWHVPGTWISSNQKPATIHDFGGFPQALFDCQYPCDGAPELAESLSQVMKAKGFSCGLSEQWGLDHGSWVLLKHLYPEADIPVLQISLDNQQNDLYYHYDLAQCLKSFREKNILFIGSGNVVHNIAKWMQMRPGDATDWAVDFDAAINQAIENNQFDRIANYQQLPFAQEAVPTIEHFLPLIYCLGLSGSRDYQLSAKDIITSSFGFHDLSTACSRSYAFV